MNFSEERDPASSAGDKIPVNIKINAPQVRHDEAKPTVRHETPTSKPIARHETPSIATHPKKFINTQLDRIPKVSRKTALATLALGLLTLGSTLLANKAWNMLPSIRSRMMGMVERSGKTPSIVPSATTSDDWLKSVFPYLLSPSYTPKIITTPDSFNVIYELPGFSASDLNITSDADHIYIDGYSPCHEQLQSMGLDFDIKGIEARGLCYEKRIQAQTMIPRSMHEHGGQFRRFQYNNQIDIHAYLKNGLLRIRVPIPKERTFKRRVVDLFSDIGHKVTDPVEKVAVGGQEKLHEGMEQAQDYLQYGKEKAEEYLVKPVVETFRKGQESAQSGREQAGEYLQQGKEKAQEYIQRGAEVADEYVGKPVRETFRQGQEKIQHQKEQVGEYVKRGKEYADDYLQYGKDKMHKGRDSEEEYHQQAEKRASRIKKGDAGYDRERVPVDEL